LPYIIRIIRLASSYFDSFLNLSSAMASEGHQTPASDNSSGKKRKKEVHSWIWQFATKSDSSDGKITAHCKCGNKHYNVTDGTSGLKKHLIGGKCTYFNNWKSKNKAEADRLLGKRSKSDDDEAADDGESIDLTGDLMNDDQEDLKQTTIEIEDGQVRSPIVKGFSQEFSRDKLCEMIIAHADTFAIPYQCITCLSKNERKV